MMLRRTHNIVLLVLTIAVALAGLAAYTLAPDPPRMLVTGKADVGGPFTLTAHTGERVSDEEFRGKYMLVAFGFTYCPDLCPAELQVMSAALDAMGAEAAHIQPLFITIDPERDTAARLGEYVAHFHPKLIGLTGSPDEIAAVARAYRVWYEKVEDEASPDGYLMDHTSITYLMDPDGEFVQHFSFGTSPRAIAEALLAAVQS
jgi:cytochrome oxidase Cu insertion factor (SCO1/SenC/PrrC family)